MRPAHELSPREKITRTPGLDRSRAMVANYDLCNQMHGTGLNVPA